MKCRSIASLIIWNIGLTIALAIVAELIFGSWMRSPGLWELGIFRNVRWDYSVAHLYPRTERTTYIRDYYGLRGSGINSAATVLAVGGSTTDERFVDERETWTETLAGCLSDSTGIPLGVANAGIPGQTTRGHIVNFEYWFSQIPGLRPKVVIAYFGVNDPRIDERDDADNIRNFHESDLRPSRFRVLRDWASMNSALFKLYRTIRGNVKALRAGLNHSALPSGSIPASERLEQAYGQVAGNRMGLDSSQHLTMLAAYGNAHAGQLAAFSRRLARLHAAIVAFGATPVFVTQAYSSYRLSDGEVSGALTEFIEIDAYDRQTMEYCRVSGITCLDLARDVHFDAGDFYDQMHTTPSGSAKIGNYICGQLRRDPDLTARLTGGRRPEGIGPNPGESGDGSEENPIGATRNSGTGDGLRRPVPGSAAPPSGRRPPG